MRIHKTNANGDRVAKIGYFSIKCPQSNPNQCKVIAALMEIHINVNGKPTVTIDYRGMEPAVTLNNGSRPNTSGNNPIHVNSPDLMSVIKREAQLLGGLND